MTAASISAAGTRRIRAAPRALLQHGLADVVAVELAAACGCGSGDMARPVGPKIRPFSSAGVCARGARRASCGALAQDGCAPCPRARFEMMACVLAGIGRPLVHGVADVDAVVAGACRASPLSIGLPCAWSDTLGCRAAEQGSSPSRASGTARRSSGRSRPRLRSRPACGP